MGAYIWLGFMLVVLLVWFLWLRSDYDHPESQARADRSLKLVILIGCVSFLVVFLLTKTQTAP